MEPIQLIITFEPGKPIQVTGPIQLLHDKIACYGLLDCAKDAIRSVGTKDTALIQPANGGVANRLKLGG